MEDEHGPVRPWSQDLAALRTAMEQVRTTPLSCLDPTETVAWATELETLGRQLSAASLAALGEIDRTGHPAVRRRADLVGLLARALGRDPRAVSADLHFERWLRALPLLAEAFRDGRTSRAHLEVVRRNDNPRTNPHLPAAQEIFIEAAGSCTWAEFLAVVRYWALAADPDGEEPAEQVTRRHCSYRRHADGSVSGRFHLDPLSGEALHTAMTAEERKLLAHDHDATTTAQRRADALVRLLSRGAAAAGGPSAAPLIHLVMSQAVAEAALTGHHDGPALDPTDPDRRCELVDGTPIHPRFALGLLATATLRRLVLGADSEILDLGRSVRTFPRQLRQAIIATAQGRCQHPTCTSPAAWLQADHLIPWSRNGPTATSNSQALCGPHNQMKRDQWPL